jgi:AmmeMemoRadiSam system protein B
MSLAKRAVYPTQPVPLRKEVARLLREAPAHHGDQGDILALVVPDTNRLGAGSVAAHAYSMLRAEIEHDGPYQTVIIISPSHDGAFGRLAIARADHYHTPLGPVAVNDALRNELCDEDDDIFLDDSGHYHTEGVDVQLPFLLEIMGVENGEPAFDIVPIVMGDESPDLCRELGTAVGEVMYGRRALVLATADVLEVEGDGWAAFTEALGDYNISELMHLLRTDAIQVEGMGAVLVAMLAAQHRGATKADLLAHQKPQEGCPGAMAIAFRR